MNFIDNLDYKNVLTNCFHPCETADTFKQVPEVRDGSSERRNYHKRDVSASAPGNFFMRVYLDESGDAGWNLSAPYRHGGSSHFLCLAFVFVPPHCRKVPAAVVAGMYARYGWKDEKKASKCSVGVKRDFFLMANAALKEKPEIRVECIVANKQKVQPHIRQDPNKLYNYMCRLVIMDYVQHLSAFEFIPDKRSIKVESGNSLSDYLQTVIWFDCNAATKLMNNPQESHRNYNLQFADWMANGVWSHFENGEKEVFQEVQRHIKIRKLFF